MIWSDVISRRLMAWHPDGHVHTVLDPTWFINGNALLPDGGMVHCEHGRRCVSLSRPGKETLPLITHYQGGRLNAPNDIVLGPDDTIWFTDPVFGISSPREGYIADPELPHRSVYRYHRASATLTRMADLDQPNGLAFSPDGQTLYVSDTSRAIGGAPIPFRLSPSHDMGPSPKSARSTALNMVSPMVSPLIIVDGYGPRQATASISWIAQAACWGSFHCPIPPPIVLSVARTTGDCSLPAISTFWHWTFGINARDLLGRITRLLRSREIRATLFPNPPLVVFLSTCHATGHNLRHHSG